MASNTLKNACNITNGMSTSTDYTKAGADGVFTRLNKPNHGVHRKSGGEFRYIINNEHIARLKFRAYDGDNN